MCSFVWWEIGGSGSCWFLSVDWLVIIFMNWWMKCSVEPSARGKRQKIPSESIPPPSFLSSYPPSSSSAYPSYGANSYYSTGYSTVPTPHLHHPPPDPYTNWYPHASFSSGLNAQTLPPPPPPVSAPIGLLNFQVLLRWWLWWRLLLLLMMMEESPILQSKKKKNANIFEKLSSLFLLRFVWMTTFDFLPRVLFLSFDEKLAFLSHVYVEDDSALADLLLAWYYSGYYTGRYQVIFLMSW